MRDPLKRPLILAMDSSLNACTAGVYDSVNKHLLATRTLPMARGQSEELVPLVQDVLSVAGVSFADLGLIVTTVGPGGFTGLRIGLSTARSFATALDIPVEGVLTTEVIAQQVYNQNKDLNGDLIILIETKRSDLYYHRFKSQGNPLSSADTIKISNLANSCNRHPLYLAGDGVARCRETLGADWPKEWVALPGGDYPDPQAMVEVALSAKTPRPAMPVYLRGADVSLSNRPQRVIASE